MTDPKPTRPRFSLITLIVAVNVAGVLVWANVRGVERLYDPVSHFGEELEEGEKGMSFSHTSYPWMLCRERGWPFVFASIGLRYGYPNGFAQTVPTDKIGTVYVITDPPASTAHSSSKATRLPYE